MAHLQDISLVAAFLLAAAASVLWLIKGWLAPLACSVPAAYGIYGAIALIGWANGSQPPFAVALAFPVAAFGLFTAMDFAGLIRKRLLVARDRRLLQGANAAGAAGLGLLTTARYFSESLVGFYFIFGLLFLGAALLYYRRAREDELAHTWFAAGMGFLALGLMELLDARTRWIALAVQSMVVLFTARRTRLWTAEATMGALWVGSVGLFLHDTAGAGLFENPGAIWSLWGAATVVYLILSGMMLSLQARWLRDRPVVFADEGGRVPPEEIRRWRGQLNVVYATVLGVAACAGAFAGFVASVRPSGAIALAILLVGVAAIARHWLPLAASALPFVFGQIHFWVSAVQADAVSAIWLNGGAALGSALGLAIVVQGMISRGRLPAKSVQASFWIAHGFWLVSLQALLFKVASLGESFLVSAVVALVLLLIAAKRRVNELADLVSVPVVFALLAAGWARAEGLPNLPVGSDRLLLWSAAIGAFFAVCARDGWSRLEDLHVSSASRFAGAVAVTILGVYVVGSEFDYPLLPAVLGTVGMAVLLLARWPGWPAGVYSAIAFFLAGHGAFLVSLGFERGDEAVSALVLAGLTLAGAVMGGEKRFISSRGFGRFSQWLMAILGLGSLFLLFLTRTNELAPFTTVFWGLSAIVVFAMGLVWRVKPLRVVGLLGLGLCLPRVFLVDIHSTFYRIAAFVVVGLVLLIVGFLYHKFRGHIAGAGVSVTNEDERDS